GLRRRFHVRRLRRRQLGEEDQRDGQDQAVAQEHRLPRGLDHRRLRRPGHLPGVHRHPAPPPADQRHTLRVPCPLPVVRQQRERLGAALHKPRARVRVLRPRHGRAGARDLHRRRLFADRHRRPLDVPELLRGHAGGGIQLVRGRARTFFQERAAVGNRSLSELHEDFVERTDRDIAERYPMTPKAALPLGYQPCRQAPPLYLAVENLSALPISPTPSPFFPGAPSSEEALR
ncbi:unnamed protein product, partial [Prorocentrum cordatum]